LAYAIVEVSGKQFRVEENMSILVPRLDKEEGEEITIDNVLLYHDDNTTVAGQPVVEKAEVKAKITEHTRGKKVTVFKMKRRKGYRKKTGARPHSTSLQIIKVAMAK
jgi:large subunit ribosomal protein L21